MSVPEYLITTAVVGDQIVALSIDLMKWSEATFGDDSSRGPLGALKHLEKEAKEAQALPTAVEEYADCLILILDASRRAGIKLLPLILAARDKLEVNKKRSWPTPIPDEPVEHVR